MNKKSQKSKLDKEIEDRINYFMEKGIELSLKSRGLDADKILETNTEEENNTTIKGKTKTKTDKQLLNDAFSQLRKHGYFAQQNFSCCQTCGVAEVPDKYADKYVFYDIQDGYDIEIKGRINKYGMCVTWAGDAKQITDIISQTGLKAYWNGDRGTRILILPRNTSPKQYKQITSAYRKCKDK